MMLRQPIMFIYRFMLGYATEKPHTEQAATADKETPVIHLKYLHAAGAVRKQQQAGRTLRYEVPYCRNPERLNELNMNSLLGTDVH